MKYPFLFQQYYFCLIKIDVDILLFVYRLRHLVFDCLLMIKCFHTLKSKCFYKFLVLYYKYSCLMFFLELML
ncbi:hypothetical protein CDX27_08830 [Campylobacter coli]|nr:hypothetical protein [Campylobacter coli]EDP4324857.1 hypothetical protein [Campylobacter jejuni]